MFGKRFSMGAAGTGRRPPQSVTVDDYRNMVRFLIACGKTFIGAVRFIDERILRSG